MNRGQHRFNARTGLLFCALSVAAFCAPLHAQQALPPVRPSQAQFDPSDVYFQGYLLSQDAEKLAAGKEYSKSLEKYQQAQQLFGRIRTYFPTWRTDMLELRQSKTQAAIDQVAPEALKEQSRAHASIAEFEGGRTGDSDPSPKTLAPAPDSQGDTLATRRIAGLENTIRDLQQKLRDSSNPLSSRDASRVEDIARQKDLLQSQLQQKTDELNSLRSNFAQPMQEEQKRLEDRVKSLESDNADSQKALKNSMSALESNRKTIDALQKERSSLLQKQSDLKEALKIQSEASNQVVEGQQKQIRQLQETLHSKDTELEQAAARITRLENQVNEMDATFKEMAEEKEAVTRERDQMASLLKLNEGGQLSELINQNMSLAKQLREATEKFDRVSKDVEGKNDEYAAALNDLVVAKTLINNFKQQKAQQDRHIAELEQRLQAEDKSLQANAGGDPAETEVLRKIIQKQMRQQDRRRESRELLLQAIGDKAKEDPAIASALELFDSAEIPLSPEERSKVDGSSDGTIRNSTRSSAEVNRSTAELEKDNAPYKKAAQRAFINQRLESAKELLELVTEANPGDIQAICSLGVINLRSKDVPGSAMAAVDNFRRAVELDPKNPYAQRMLGKSLFEAGSAAGAGADTEAETAFKRAVELAPTNAANQIALGAFYFEIGREKEAEDALKAAIACDDTLPEPYYNVAVLYAHQGKKKKGLEYYQSALERNHAPNFELAKQLEEAPR